MRGMVNIFLEIIMFNLKLCHYASDQQILWDYNPDEFQ